jgi:hypothetical protein
MGFFVLLFVSSITSADTIFMDEIVGTQSLALVGSGNGTLDLRLMTFSGSEIQNTAGLFNGDNGNNTLPQGGGADTLSFAESYVTSGLELKDFYRLNFPDGNGGSTVNELVLFIDINETGDGQAINNIDKIDIVQNATTINGNPDPNLDVSSVTQAAIDQIFTGGTLLANLFSSPVIVPVNEQGAGHADYAIFTGIDPFTLGDSDSLLFNISLSASNNGSEEIFLSGEFARQTSVPEPNALLLISLGAILFAKRQRPSPAVH